MTLNAPRVLFYILALVIALIAVLSNFISAMAGIPITPFWLMTVAFVILALSCVIKGM